MFIDNCLIKWKITFTPSTRWINVAASNNTFLNEYFSISNLVYEDLDQYDPSKKITFFNNINYYRGNASADRDYDRTSNNLVVGGSLEVYEDLTVGDEIIFKTDKTMTKEIWIYKELINSLLHAELLSELAFRQDIPDYIYLKNKLKYAARSPFMDLSNADATAEDYDDVTEMVQIFSTNYNLRARYYPVVRIHRATSPLKRNKIRFILPFSDGQRLSTINIYPANPSIIVDGSDYLEMAIYKISHREFGAYDAPVLVGSSSGPLQILGGGEIENKKISWDLDLLVDTSEWSYLLEIENLYTSDIHLTRAVLKFKSKKLFELIGLK